MRIERSQLLPKCPVTFQIQLELTYHCLVFGVPIHIKKLKLMVQALTLVTWATYVLALRGGSC